MGFRSSDTRTRTADQQKRRDVYICNEQLSVDIGPKVNSHSLHTRQGFQAMIHLKIAIADAMLPLERTSMILGVLLDTSFAFHHHCENVAKRVSKRNNILKPKGPGRHITGTAERDPADDIQGRRTLDRQLRSSCLEHQHQHGENPSCTERSSQNFHRRTQDVKP